MNGLGTSRRPRGVVVSDLHLFSGRSEGSTQMAALRPMVATARVLVLNGDIFDFRWSTLRDACRTVTAATDWLTEWVAGHPDCAVHYIVGNHDCCRRFTRELVRLEAALPRFRWHEHVLRLGSAVFLHGDCTHRSMDPGDLESFRERWRRDWQRGPLLTAGYRWVDRLGITGRVHTWHFPRQRTVERISRYLDQTCVGWRSETRDCYFGHTHLPFENYEFGGVRFHNTGSAIRWQEFKPLVFEPATESGAPPESRRSG